MINEKELAIINQNIADVKILLAELEAVADALHKEQQHAFIDSLQSLDDEQYHGAIAELKDGAEHVLSAAKNGLNTILRR